MPFAPGRLEVLLVPSAHCKLVAPQGLSAPCRLDAVQMPFSLGKLAVVQTLFVLGRPDAVQMLSLLGSSAVPGKSFGPLTLFVPQMPSAPHTPVFLLRASPDKLAAPGMLADLGKVAVPYRLFVPQAPVFPYLPAAPHRLVSPGRLLALELWHGRGLLPLKVPLCARSGV